MFSFLKALTEKENRYVAYIALLAALGRFLFEPSVLGRDGTMWFFALFALVALVFTVWRVPETKKRSLEEIEHEVIGEALSKGAEAA